jgi:hypothetical protein
VPGRPNPFRTSVTVDAEFFTDRADEVARIRRALTTPAARLLVYGHRRMGKSSAIARAIRQIGASRGGGKGLAFLADLSTTSTAVDIANRIMESATRALGRTWKDLAADWVTRVGATLKLTPDAKTGLVIPSLEVGLRRADQAEQRQTLERVLDAVDAMAAARRRTIGIALDEFQEITKVSQLGGEDAEWHLRGVMQRHEHVSYVLAGSEPHLIQRMIGPKRAFYNMLEVLAFGPMDADHLARWIEERMRGAGVKAADVGRYIVELAGPGTRDVVLVAQRTFALCDGGAGKATASIVDDAFAQLIDEQDDLMHAFWEELTALQQNVLRAVAVRGAGLTSGEVQEQFGLTSSSATTQALATFVEDGRLVRTEDGYSFDNPLMRGWVIDRTLPDLGMRFPITYRPR